MSMIVILESGGPVDGIAVRIMLPLNHWLAGNQLIKQMSAGAGQRRVAAE